MKYFDFGWEKATSRMRTTGLVEEKIEPPPVAKLAAAQSEVRVQMQPVSIGLYQMFDNQHQQQALLTILYSLEPQEVGDPFIEVRRWETFSGDCCELIVETGYVDENGDLQTTCKVLPFHMDVYDALLTAAE